jgi:hypothetical protein
VNQIQVLGWLAGRLEWERNLSDLNTRAAPLRDDAVWWFVDAPAPTAEPTPWWRRARRVPRSGDVRTARRAHDRSVRVRAILRHGWMQR